MGYILSFGLRFTQAALSASPYLFAGIVAAAAIRVFVGHAALRRWLAGDRLSGSLKAWGLGILLPVCSFGVLPVARELLKAGVSRSTTFLFLVAAPLFHPLSIAYGLTVMDAAHLLLLAGGSLLIIGIASQWCESRADVPATVQTAGTAAELSPDAPSRLGVFLLALFQQFDKKLLQEILLGLCGVGLLGAMLAPDSLGGTLGEPGSWSGLSSCLLATPIYMPSEQAVAVLDEMLAHGNTLSAAFALLVCGVGMNLGTLLASSRFFGLRSTAAAVATLWCGVVILGSLANQTIYVPNFAAGDEHASHGVAGHTHAFDAYGRPATLSHEGASWGMAVRLLRSSIRSTDVAMLAVNVFLGFIALAIATQRGGPAIIKRLSTEKPNRQATVWNQPLPSRTLTVAALIGIVFGGYAAALIAFPAPEEVLADMSIVRVEAMIDARGEKFDSAETSLEAWATLARKLPLGSLLRGRGSGEQRIAAQVLRQSIGDLRSAIRNHDADGTLRQLERLDSSYQQCKAVFSGEPLTRHEGDEANGMPSGVSEDEERDIYLLAGGLYTEADIEANGRQTASQKYRGFRSAHDMNPAVGAPLCPVTLTKANSKCTWIIGGERYQFCCPPCIDEFVKLAKESPEQIKSPGEYVKR